MKRLFLVLAAVAVAAILWWLYARRSGPPEVPFTKAKRERLVSTLTTNGKVEPVEWVAVRAQRAGLVSGVRVRQGGRVGSGAVLLEMDAREAKAELTSAEARIREARAGLDVIEQGGRSAELAQIESDGASARAELEAAVKEHAAMERLAGKQAATGFDVAQAAERVAKARLQVQALDRKRAALVSDTDRTIAQAKLQEAEGAAGLARQRIEQASVRSPISGVVYDMDIRPGAFLNPGDLVAKIGRIERVEVRVYVDEPELGRVKTGVPVAITWDAAQGREWRGVVDRMPAQIVALGTRQVGEVVCRIENPGGELLPGTNVNAAIRSAVVDDAITIPREALRRESGQDGIFSLSGERLAWRRVVLGVTSATRSQVVEGLSEGDSVALPSERTLAQGLTVRPVYRE